MDAQNSWCVSELLLADCKQAWLCPGWENTIDWVQEKKMDEKKIMEDERQKLVGRMRRSSDKKRAGQALAMRLQGALCAGQAMEE